ncbi:MAG: hypothetical protein IT379_25460 [Deltaproteobacteria bacterium]|nr:hypothetical protein [Deltaproteobacteria bacterium]
MLRLVGRAAVPVVLVLAGCAMAPSETAPRRATTHPQSAPATTPAADDPRAAPPATTERGAPYPSLYTAEAVMDHQSALALTPAQTSAIQQDLRASQAALLDLDWQLRGAEEQLRSTLAAEPIDEQRAARDAEAVARLEGSVKVAHLRLLVRIRNALTPTQRATLDALRGAPR